MNITTLQKDEIAALQAETFQTRRPTVSALETILYEPLPVLDHGFVRVVDYMGDDTAVVQAARVSYGKGTKQVNQDRGLIHYLMRHWHTTPFEMCEIKFHVKLPIFVARQWIRHRTANVNEYSARYSIMDKEFYIPKPEHVAPQSNANHQGRDESTPLTPAECAEVLRILKNDSEQVYGNYEQLMNSDQAGNVLDESKSGIARELARMNLTLNYYTQWYWKIDLHNLMHFLRLRADAHAQYEIRAYADVMCNVLEKWLPICYEAFVEHRLHAAHVSRSGLAAIKRMLAGEKIDETNCGMSKREWRELAELIGIKA